MKHTPEASQSSAQPVARHNTVLRNLVTVLPFLLLCYVQQIHHDPWRDELNAWGIARASSTLSGLLANVHYEAHPALWYLLLYAGTKITHAAWMLVPIQAIIATAIYLLIALTTRFSTAEKVLIYLSYYIVFEYTVLCRMYGLLVVFAFAYLFTRTHHPKRVVLNAVWLGLIANVDTTGIILAGGLALEYILNHWKSSRAEGIPTRRQWAAGALTLLLLVAISIATLRPTKDISWRTTGHILVHAREARHLGQAIVSWTVLPWMPITSAFPRIFWFMEGHARDAVAIPFIFAALYLIFRGHRALACMIFATMAAGTLFSHLIYIGSPRHFGIVFIVFLVALGILRYEKAPVHPITYALFALCAAGGLCTEYGQWVRPFSTATETAQWIRQQRLQDLPLIGTPDTHVIGVPILLQRPIYMLDCQCVDTYLKFSNRRDSFDPEDDLVPRLVAAMPALRSHEAVYISNRPFTGQELAALAKGGMHVVFLKTFDDSEVPDELFTLYRVTT